MHGGCVNQSSEEIMWRILGNAARKVGKRKNDAVLRQNLIDKYYFIIAACLACFTPLKLH